MKTFEDYYQSTNFLDVYTHWGLVEFHSYEDDKWATLHFTRSEIKELIEHLQELVEDE